MLPNLLAVVLSIQIHAAAQTIAPPDATSLPKLMQQVVDEQAQYLRHEGAHFRYHLHRVDPKEDTLRDVIETPDGAVTRLLQHNGQALTPAEDAGDRQRLSEYIQSGDLRKKQKDERHNQSYGLELLSVMPQAMIYTTTPGQPQLPNLDRPQWVLDFVPNPQFHPKSVAEALSTGLAGRLWIDAADHHLVRVEVHTNRNLDIALGLLIRVYPGGTVEYDQRRIAEGFYAYTHIRMHLRLRELMVRTVPYDSDLVATDLQLLQPPPTAQQAIDTLLREQVPTR